MEFNIWLLIAGIGLLIFGMNTLENSFKYLGGKKLKQILEKYTKNGWMSIRTGTWTTTVLQSSSIVSLLVLAFAGAGVMSLYNAIGVIIGANIGSPMLPLLAAIIGFGQFKISAFALPMIGIGGVSLIFLKNERYIQWAKLLLGFGLLFLGLDFMKESVDAIKASFDLTQYANLSLRGFGLLGVIATVVIQSSGALGIMALAALDGGLISFPASIAIAMGANIGTTFTAVIGSLGGERIKRQIAVSHVVFNILSGLIGVLFFRQYIWFTMDFLGFSSNPVMGNAVLNVIFNASTAIFFGFIIKPFTRLVLWIMPNREKDSLVLHVEEASMKSQGTTFMLPKLYALHEDAKTLIDITFTYNLYTFGIESEKMFQDEYEFEKAQEDIVQRQKSDHKMYYQRMKYIGNTMLSYLVPLNLEKLGKEEGDLLHHTDKSIQYCFRSAKSMKNIYHDIQELRASNNPVMDGIYEKMLQYTFDLYRDMAMILDREYESEDFKELSKTLKTMKDYQKGFMEEITQLLVEKKITDVEISELMNIDDYLYQSSKMLVKAIQHSYLSIDEASAFEKLSEGDEE